MQGCLTRFAAISIRPYYSNDDFKCATHFPYGIDGALLYASFALSATYRTAAQRRCARPRKVLAVSSYPS